MLDAEDRLRVDGIAKDARNAALSLAVVSNELRNKALDNIMHALENAKDIIIEANKIDMLEASKIDINLLKRLDLSRNNTFDTMVHGVSDIISLADPINKILTETLVDDGLVLKKVSCPIGVILIIFEARPEVLVNVSALAIKSGNAVVLKGGKESKNSLTAIFQVMSAELDKLDYIPSKAIQLIFSHNEVSRLLESDKYIDLVIPRGGKSLIQSVKAQTKIPVLSHADGICTIYVHQDANLELAKNVILDSKLQYPAACNACETLLVHNDVPKDAFHSLLVELMAKNIALHLDTKLYLEFQAFTKRKNLSGYEKLIIEALAEDFETEYLDAQLSVKQVSSLEEAIDHINTHGSKHTDSIITEDTDTANSFMLRVDSSSVFHNCSTRFADGFRYGFGAEVGISTNKLHARGPVGLEGLTIYKYLMTGAGHTVDDYVTNKKRFKHHILS